MIVNGTYEARMSIAPVRMSFVHAIEIPIQRR